MNHKRENRMMKRIIRIERKCDILLAESLRRREESAAIDAAIDRMHAVASDMLAASRREKETIRRTLGH